MTHFLRYNGKTILDVETKKADLSAVVCIDVYSELLLQLSGTSFLRDELIKDFNDMQELRGEYFEVVQAKETPNKFVKRRLKQIAEKWKLQYVTD